MAVKKTPYIGFSNETLDDNLPLHLGQRITCKRCGEEHVVRGSKNKDGEEAGTLMYCVCDGVAYIVGVHGKSVLGQRPDVSGELGGDDG